MSESDNPTQMDYARSLGEELYLPRRPMYGRDLDRQAALVEVVSALSAFIAWFVLNSATPFGMWLTFVPQKWMIYGEVLANGLFALAVACLIQRLGRHRTQDLGFTEGSSGLDLAAGIAAVIPVYGLTAALSFMMMWLATQFSDETLESIAQDKMGMFEVIGGVSPVAVIPISLFIGFYEELFFRGLVMGRLIAVTRSSFAAVMISSIIFGLLHLPSQGWIGLVQTAFLGCVLGLLSLWRRSLWPAIACHAGIDIIGIFLTLILGKFLNESGLAPVPSLVILGC